MTLIHQIDEKPKPKEKFISKRKRCHHGLVMFFSFIFGGVCGLATGYFLFGYIKW